MKIVTNLETKEFRNSAACIAVEYPFNDPDINIGVIKLTGRYPEKGFAINQKSKEIGFVMTGQGIVGTEDQVFTLHTGDSVLIEPHEKFYWEGAMTLLMPCTPPWTPEQYEQVD